MPILAYPQPGKLFILDMDGSNESICAVLFQEIDSNECYCLLECVFIKTGAKLLHNQERTTGNSKSHRTLPSLSLQEKILRADHASLT